MLSSKSIIGQVDIEDYISRYVKLQMKKPGEYVGLCPFHNEKTPSFAVSTTKKIFHCFGCKASGDVIKFAMTFHNLDYKSAIESLAKEYNIDIKFDDSSSDNYKEIDKHLAINLQFTEICHFIISGIARL